MWYFPLSPFYINNSWQNDWCECTVNISSSHRICNCNLKSIQISAIAVQRSHNVHSNVWVYSKQKRNSDEFQVTLNVGQATLRDGCSVLHFVWQSFQIVYLLFWHAKVRHIHEWNCISVDLCEKKQVYDQSQARNKSQLPFLRSSWVLIKNTLFPCVLPICCLLK